MGEPGRDGDLPEKALRAEVRRHFGPQHLDRHLPLVFAVKREVHRGGSAPSQLAVERVAVGERGDERREGERCSHVVWGPRAVLLRTWLVISEFRAWFVPSGAGSA